MLRLLTGSCGRFSMGYSPQFAAGERNFQHAAVPAAQRIRPYGLDNRTKIYSVLRYSGNISYRFIAAFRVAGNSLEAMRRISLFNLCLFFS